MIAVISPAKRMQPGKHRPDLPETYPVFAEDAVALAGRLAKMKQDELARVLDVRGALAEESHDLYRRFSGRFSHENSTPAILLFAGDVYRGLDADSLSGEDLVFAQGHLRILSGLYGVLRPLDLIQPYRLMMGTSLSMGKGIPDLYTYWGDRIARYLDAEMKRSQVLVNLASAEYFRAIRSGLGSRRVVACDFLERKGNETRSVSTYAKLARGRMARFILTHRIQRPEDLRAFDQDGYVFRPGLSTDDRLVFVRG